MKNEPKSPEDVLTFGKNKGLSLEVVWKYQPTYITWLIVNTNNFCIDAWKFKKLPSPTPFTIGAIPNTTEYQEIMNSSKSLVDKYQKIDNGYLINVMDIIKLEESGKMILKSEEYWFSDEVLLKNKQNMEQGGPKLELKSGLFD